MNAKIHNSSIKKNLVPRVGVEPTWALSPLDFESSAYTNFATQARTLDIKLIIF